MKKIFIAAEIFPPALGGPATYAVELVNALSQRGFQVRILCYGWPDKSVLNQSVKINWVSNRWPLAVKYCLYFKKLFWYSLGYQTIYAMGPVASGLPARFVKMFTGQRLVVKVVGDYAWEQAFGMGQTQLLLDDFQTEKHQGKISLLKKIESSVCRSADAVITPSEYLKKIVTGWGVEVGKTQVIYNTESTGVVVDKQRDNDLIVSVGRLVPWKGFEVLIKLMPELLQINNNFKLLIYGGGPEKDNLLRLINQLKISERVEIKNASHDEVLQSLRVAGLFVLNTGYEGLSHVILEAFAGGVPVITTNVGGNPELVKNNENGLLVDYNNSSELKLAILKLYNNRKLREDLVNNARQVLKKFNTQEMINNTVKVLI